MELKIVDFYPNAKQTDVPLNVQCWVQFNQPINWNENTGYMLINLTEADTLDMVHSTVTVSEDKTVIYIQPVSVLKANTKFIFYVFGGTSGISAYSEGETVYLDTLDNSWDFTTGTDVLDDEGDQVPPSGDITYPSGVVSGYLSVLSTDPANNDTHQNINLQSIAVKFNYPPTLPSGSTWFDIFDITRQGVLG